MKKSTLMFVLTLPLLQTSCVLPTSGDEAGAGILGTLFGAGTAKSLGASNETALAVGLGTGALSVWGTKQAKKVARSEAEWDKIQQSRPIADPVTEWLPDNSSRVTQEMYFTPGPGHAGFTFKVYGAYSAPVGDTPPELKQVGVVDGSWLPVQDPARIPQPQQSQVPLSLQPAPQVTPQPFVVPEKK